MLTQGRLQKRPSLYVEPLWWSKEAPVTGSREAAAAL